MDELSTWLRERLRLVPVRAGQELRLGRDEVFGLLEGVVELDGSLLEGPELVNAGGMNLRLPTQLPETRGEGLRLRARTDCVWGVASHEDLRGHRDEAAVLHLRDTREALRRRLRGLDDFLDPRDASIPAGVFAGEDVDLVLVAVRGPPVVEELEELGLRPVPRFGARRLLAFAHYPAIGGGGRVTSYAELAEFVPCLDGARPALYARRIQVDSFAAALVGRELYGFPKEVGPVGLGKRAGWARGLASLTWSDEEHIDELDRLGVSMLNHLLDVGGGFFERASDLFADLVELDSLVHAATLLRLRVVMPDGQRAWLRLQEPRQPRRLVDPVLDCASLGQMLVAWRLRLDLALEAPEELPVAPERRVPQPLPELELQNYVFTAGAVGSSELTDELRRRARSSITLQDGQRGRFSAGRAVVVENGAVLSHVIDEGGRVLEGVFRGGELIGWLDDGLDRELEAVGPAFLLVVPVDLVARAAEMMGTSAPRRRAWLRDSRALADLDIARQASSEARWSLALPLPAAPGWEVPRVEGLSPRAGSPTLLARRAQREQPFLPHRLGPLPPSAAAEAIFDGPRSW